MSFTKLKILTATYCSIVLTIGSVVSWHKWRLLNNLIAGLNDDARRMRGFFQTHWKPFCHQRGSLAKKKVVCSPNCSSLPARQADVTRSKNERWSMIKNQRKFPLSWKTSRRNYQLPSLFYCQGYTARQSSGKCVCERERLSFTFVLLAAEL